MMSRASTYFYAPLSAALVLTGCGLAEPEAEPAIANDSLGESIAALEADGGGFPSPDLCRSIPPPAADLQRDLTSTKLSVDLGAHTARATISFAASLRQALSLRTGDLVITSVRDACGPLRFRVGNGQLDIGTRFTLNTVVIDYRFADHPGFDGWMPTGTSFTWPYFCENLFPCHPQLTDGVTFELDVRNQPAGDTLIYPTEIRGQSPVYMLAWATGQYTELALGTTRDGTDVSVWYLPGQAEAAVRGTAHLTGAFEFFEETYGDYIYGEKVGSVSANWGPGAYGGMEHHPYWHVAGDALGDKLIHQHEAAHGWYGNGVRPKCWEDFVLSEGTAEWLTARSIRATEGAGAEEELWTAWRARLGRVVAASDTIALPDSTCNAIDIFNHPLWSNVPYIKGAFFYKALEQQIGERALDRALSAFYRRHVGGAARMQQFLDLVKQQTGYDPTALANSWLRSMGHPTPIP